MPKNKNNRTTHARLVNYFVYLQNKMKSLNVIQSSVRCVFGLFRSDRKNKYHHTFEHLTTIDNKTLVQM